MRVVEKNLDLRSYRLEAIKKAAYRLANRCTIELGTRRDEQILLTLSFRGDPGEVEVEETIRLFHQELLDEELRAAIREETEPLRALIFAQAFSRANLIEEQ